MAKKSKVGSWWGQMLINAGATFGLSYLAAIQQGLKPSQAAQVAGVSVLAPAIGVPIATTRNPDGSPTKEPYYPKPKSKL